MQQQAAMKKVSPKLWSDIKQLVILNVSEVSTL